MNVKSGQVAKSKFSNVVDYLQAQHILELVICSLIPKSLSSPRVDHPYVKVQSRTSAEPCALFPCIWLCRVCSPNDAFL